jgi:hypothetical protein
VMGSRYFRSAKIVHLIRSDRFVEVLNWKTIASESPIRENRLLTPELPESCGECSLLSSVIAPPGDRESQG